MNFFSKRSSEDDPEPKANETAPGVRMLRQVWQIDSGKKPRETVDHDSVSSDIYRMQPRNGHVPPRDHLQSASGA